MYVCLFLKKNCINSRPRWKHYHSLTLTIYKNVEKLFVHLALLFIKLWNSQKVKQKSYPNLLPCFIPSLVHPNNNCKWVTEYIYIYIYCIYMINIFVFFTQPFKNKHLTHVWHTYYLFFRFHIFMLNFWNALLLKDTKLYMYVCLS